MNRQGWIARIARALQQPDPLRTLSEQLPASDLQSLLLHVFRERSAARTPAELLAQFERSPMVRPAAVDPRVLAQLECAALACASEFEAVELAPVAPLGVNTVLGGIDQNNCLATIRGTEVLADPTTAAALECARRRRAGQLQPISLCSRSRLLRLQPLKGPGFFPHFGIFSLVTSALDRGSFQVEIEALRQHLTVYLELLSHQSRLRGARYELAISDTERDRRRLEAAETQLLRPLRRAYPGTSFRIDSTREQGRSYYRGLCISADAIMPGQQRWNLVDGGFTDWTQRLLSNAKERLLVSAVGLERMASAGVDASD